MYGAFFSYWGPPGVLPWCILERVTKLLGAFIIGGFLGTETGRACMTGEGIVVAGV